MDSDRDDIRRSPGRDAGIRIVADHGRARAPPSLRLASMPHSSHTNFSGELSQ